MKELKTFRDYYNEFNGDSQVLNRNVLMVKADLFKSMYYYGTDDIWDYAREKKDELTKLVIPDYNSLALDCVEDDWEDRMDEGADEIINEWVDEYRNIAWLPINQMFGEIEISKAQSTIVKLKRDLGQYKGKDKVSVVWNTDDVRQVLDECGYMNYTDEDVRDILQRCVDKHDAEFGINWEVIQAHAEYLLK
ncbi:MAG: hypothetical protein MPJ25_01690 [Pirellulales bacterium]|nr:hypothetical protein [Pirellulales bacterium]